MGRTGLRSAGWIWVLVPVSVFLALYLRALDYGFVWTDQAEIENGLLIREPGDILAAFGEPMYKTLADIAPTAAQPYYRPLHVATISLIDQHLGREPRNFRAGLFALGAATVATFFLFVLALTGDGRAAAVAASIAAAHPAGIEDYVWIAGYSAAIATFFICLGLLVVPRLLRAKTRAQQIAFVSLGTGALALGLFGKESAAVLPALTLSCIVSLVAREESGRSLAELISAVATRARPALWLVGAQGFVVAIYLFAIRPAVLGGTLSGAPPIGRNYGLHLTTVMATWPDRLAWIVAPITSTTSDVVALAGLGSPMAWLGFALLVSAPLLWLRFLRRGQVLAALGFSWVWIAFLPTSGIVPLTHVVAVRYVSLCVFGAALIWLDVVPGLRLTGTKAARRWASLGVSALLILGLAERSFARIPDWRSDFTLFESAVAGDPLYREGYYVLAVRHAEQRRFSPARAQLDALRIANGKFAGYASFLRQEDVALLLCKINLEIGDPQDSLTVLRHELRPDSSLLTSAPELMNCAMASLARVGRGEEAREIRRALETAR